MERKQSSGFGSRIGEIKKFRPSLAKGLFTFFVHGRKACGNDRERADREQRSAY